MPTVIDRFYQTARDNPQSLAVISDTEALSYEYLRIRLEQIASEIDQWFEQDRGYSPSSGDIIAICMDKSADLLASILAIMALGAAYVPIDPELDKAAQSHILERCRARLIIAKDGALCGHGAVGQINPANIASAVPSACGLPRAQPQDPSYVIFTSGSTGQPKGVQIHHQNLLNLVEWVVPELALGKGRRVLQYSTINFDASVLDIFPALLSGATLCIPNREQCLSENELARFCERHQVNQAFLPPALLAVLHADRFPTIETILTGGETCSSAAVKMWLEGRKFYNLYGPTECTVLVSFKRMLADTEQSNIGRAIPGVRLHVLDDALQPTQRGELHVAGRSVSQGYVDDPVTTGQKFTACPHVDPGTLYKTGDIVEIDRSGDLHFIGRVDRQVKVRGFRIELEEIEGALLKAGCAQAALKLSQQGALIAYFTAHDDLSRTTLRYRLVQYLSDYKLPQHFVKLDTLPQKASGKVDYAALPEISEASVNATSYVINEDDVYIEIFEMFASELNINVSDIDINSNFRTLGGSSINIICLLSAVEDKYNITIEFYSFLNNPTPNFIRRSIQ